VISLAPSARAKRLAWFIIALGVLIRLLHLLSNRSLYIDEARLALNVGSRSLTALAGPLDLEQAAPVPFVLAEKLVSQIFGMGEIALRLLPFLCGAALLLVVWAVARRLLRTPFALVALALVTVSPALVRESNNLKQYSWDALLASLTILLAVLAIRDLSDGQVRALAWYSWIACVASFTAFFVVIPSLLLVAGLIWRRGDSRRALRSLGACAAAGLATAIPYFLIYRSIAQSPYMRSFWATSFASPLPFTHGSQNAILAADAAWNFIAGGLPSVAPGWPMIALVTAIVTALTILALLGCAELLHLHGWAGALLLVGPPTLLVLASMAHLYPLRGRLEVFLMPLAALLIASGVQWVAGRTSERAGMVAALALFAPQLMTVAMPPLWPYAREELRDVVATIDSIAPHTPVYVYANAAPAWLFYTTNWDRPDSTRLKTVMALIRFGGPSFENADSGVEGSPLKSRCLHATGRLECYGRSTGPKWLPNTPHAGHFIAKCWVQPEAKDVAALATPMVWIVLAHYRGCEGPLLQLLPSQCLHQVTAMETFGAAAFRYGLSDCVPHRTIRPPSEVGGRLARP
jgi:hypothetical protein